MTTIQAVWKNGVFTPDGDVDLADGARVELRVTASDGKGASTVRVRKSDRVPLPDPPFESESQPAPFDLPMPPGGRPVPYHVVEPPLPDAHDIVE